MLKHTTKISIENLFSVLKNPTTDITYTKTKPDFLGIFEEKLGNKQSYYHYLNIDQKEWEEKLKHNELITVKDILTLADIAQKNVEFGRMLKTSAYYTIMEGQNNFEKNLKSIINEYQKDIITMNAAKDIRGLIGDRCGNSVLNSIENEQNIVKNYSLNQSVETFHKFLFALAVSLEYQPGQSNNEFQKQIELEAKTKNIIKSLNLTPYVANPEIENAKTNLSKNIEQSKIDDEIFSLIFGLNKHESDFANISLEKYIKLTILTDYGNGLMMTRNKKTKKPIKGEYETKLKEYLQKIVVTISQIPNEYKDIISQKLNIPLNYLTEPIQYIDEPESAMFFFVMSSVTQSEYYLDGKTKSELKKTLNEEIRMAKALLNEESNPVTPSPTTTFPLEPAEKIADNDKMKPKTETEIIQKENIQKTTKSQQTNPDEQKETTLLTKVLPIVMDYYDIDINEPFMINDTELQIVKAETELKILNTYQKEISPLENSKEISLLFYGDKEKFQYSKFIPTQGDEYWTFNLPEFVPVKYIFGKNAIADAISQNYDIIFRNEKQIQTADIEIIKKRIIG